MISDKIRKFGIGFSFIVQFLAWLGLFFIMSYIPRSTYISLTIIIVICCINYMSFLTIILIFYNKEKEKIK